MNDLLLSLQPLLPEVFLCLAALALLLVGAFRGERVASLLLLASAITLVCAFCLALQAAPGRQEAFFGLVVSDGFTHFSKMLLLLGGFLSLMLSSPWLSLPDNHRFEFPLLVLFSLLGMMLMVSANDLMALYLGLELSSLPLYVLAAFSRDHVKSSEAGLKYFVLSALASGMLLFGASFIYGFAGSTSFSALAPLFHAGAIASPGVVVGLVFVIIGFCFKISAVPFHMWTPDVYEGAPTPVTAFFAIAPKVAGIALFTRVLMEPFGGLFAQWQQVIVFVAVLSMAVGAFAALVQRNIKRLLAYSSIGHVGYILVGLAAGTQAGVEGMLVYLTLYVLMSAGAFGCVLLMRRGGDYVESIDDLAGLSKTQPWVACAFAIFMFSMAGIPPLAGFFGKWLVFLAAMQAGLIPLAVFGVLSSVVACFYYLKIVKVMYFDEPSAASFDRFPAAGIHYAVGLCAILIMVFILYPAPLFSAAHAAAGALLQ